MSNLFNNHAQLIQSVEMMKQLAVGHPTCCNQLCSPQISDRHPGPAFCCANRVGGVARHIVAGLELLVARFGAKEAGVAAIPLKGERGRYKKRWNHNGSLVQPFHIKNQHENVNRRMIPEDNHRKQG